jgi:IS1 family transposase
MLEYYYKAYEPGIKEKIVEMAINSSGIRDTARVLNINKNTVIRTLKKKHNSIVQVNPMFLTMNTTVALEVRLELACEEAELDEQWSFVGKKSNQRWLWHAVDHATNTVLAYVFGRRKDVVFKQLKALLAPFNISRYYTDDWGAYERHLDPEKHEVGKTNTQKIERKNLNFRTWIKRLARRTICFSKLQIMHDIVIGLLINKVEFGRDIHA